jgi:hypothetical protein
VKNSTFASVVLGSLARLRSPRPRPKCLPALRYFLEIYEPGSRSECAAFFEASTPFMNIAVGDVLNPYFFPACVDSLTLLRVTKVEHILWQPTVTPKFPDKEPAHKLLVYTEAIPL